MDSIVIFFIIGILTFLGYFYELLYKKYKISDLILLILTGFVIGPYVLNIFQPKEISDVLIQFVLLFLVFNGAFRIDFKTLATQMLSALKLSSLGYLISMLIVSIIVFIYSHNFFISLLLGSILGGISSTFVIPLLEYTDEIRKQEYTIEVLEGTLTDVFTIVVSITLIGLFTLKTFQFKMIISNLVNLFALGTFIGFVGGIVWLYLIEKLFKEHYYYVVTIAYLFLIYALTEYVGGNGVIAALFFGITLKNSKRVVSAGAELIEKSMPDDIFKLTPKEEFFYSQISFFIKTFFFIFIGASFKFEPFYLISGFVLSLSLWLARIFTVKILNISPFELYSSLFGRGVAAAVIGQMALRNGILSLDYQDIIYSTIVFTILFSSLAFYYYLHKKSDSSKQNENSEKYHKNVKSKNIKNNKENKEVKK